MKLTHARLIASSVTCALLAILSSGDLMARPRGPAAPGGVASAVRATAVHGVVWNADNTPVAGANVRLRNLQTGRIESSAVSDARGEFTFDRLEGGAYVVELVGDDGRVIALGQSFRIGPGETVATFVKVPPPRPRLAGLFSNTAAAVISAASSAGVTAIGSQARPASPQ